MFKLFIKRREDNGRWLDDENKQRLQVKAERVAWRQLLRWTQAQIAMIETGMVQAAEVFLPYMFNTQKSQTLFQTMMESQLKMLPPTRQQ